MVAMLSCRKRVCEQQLELAMEPAMRARYVRATEHAASLVVVTLPCCKCMREQQLELAMEPVMQARCVCAAGRATV